MYGLLEINEMFYFKIKYAYFSAETQVRHPPLKRRAFREANSLYFDEDFKKLRKDRMEHQLRREEQEGA